MAYAFLDNLDKDTLVVTAGQRLSRTLEQLYVRRQCEQGSLAWERPAIVPWASWLQACWEEAVADGNGRMLLAPAQERVLWERIIGESEQAHVLLQVGATARVAQEAWHLMQERDLPLAAVADAGSDDARIFAGWARRFVAWCDGQGWTDSARLTDLLDAPLRQGRVTLPATLFLAGFDEFTPQQERWLQAVAQRGCQVQTVETPAVDGRSVRVACDDPDAELQIVARWARDCVQRRPSARVGIVVPDMGARRAALVRALDAVLVPGAWLPGAAHLPRPYNLSLGQHLSAYPLVHDALLLLELARAGRQALAQVSSLLRSPFLAGAQGEHVGRARVDARLRRAGETTLALRSPLRDAAAVTQDSPQLALALERWRDAARGLSAARAPSAWVAAFARLLASLGWPGPRTQTSEEYQTLEAWRELLGRYAALDAMWPAVGYDEALRHLRAMAAETLFQPQTPEVPIQVIGVLEAAGMTFDHLWVVGMTDDDWPPPARPNPLLPVALQRRYAVPHASAERELEFCQRVNARLRASASQVVMSHARRDGDRDRRPSPLILDLPDVALDTLLSAGVDDYSAQLQRAAPALQQVEDGHAPPLVAGDPVRGGTHVIKLQSACPFRAYAELRLGAVPLDQPEIGLDAAERGALLHAVLEQVWDSVQSHARLCQLTPTQEATLVEQVVERVLAAPTTRRPHTYSARFTALEKARLQRLVREWLVLERERAPFEVVQPEAQRRIRIGGIELQTKIDRIDRLPDGELVIVDYKTGKADVAQWFGARPDEPQLPLYCIDLAADGGRVGGALFGQARLGDVRFKGLARTADLAPGVRALAQSKYAADYATWEALLATWQATLSRLATEFRDGRAAVDPKDYPKTCRYCHLTPLCRIHEVNARLGRMSLDASDLEGTVDG